MSRLAEAGLYARVGSRDVRVVRSGGWKLVSGDPASESRGFSPIGRGRFARDIGPDERIEVFRLRYVGTYAGVPVEAAPNGRGSVMLTTEDPRAQSLGFDSLDRRTWARGVPEDDGRLKLRTEREKVRAPWLDERTQREDRG